MPSSVTISIRYLVHARWGAPPVYADAIAWKWTGDNHPDLADPEIVAHGQARVDEIVEALRPRVILALGQLAADCIGVERPNKAANPAGCTIGDWTGACLSLFHPNRRWQTGLKTDYLIRARRTLTAVT